MDSTFIFLLCIPVLLYLLHIRLQRRVGKGLQYPPGPRGLPFIGLLGTDIYDASRLKKWRREYGDIISFHILGTRFVFVFSEDIATDLFERRSAIYSDRHPHTSFALQGWEFNMGFQRYGSWWRRHRRMFHQYFNANVVKRYEPTQLDATRELVQKLYGSPEDFATHVQYFAGSIILKLIYDYKLQVQNDPYIDLIRAATSGNQNALVGFSYIDFIPLLEYVPQWFPGAGWKRAAMRVHSSVTKVNTLPFAMVKSKLEDGTAGPSITADLIARIYSQEGSLPDDEEIAMNVAGVSYAAGASTVFDAMMTVILAMVLHPDAQKEAQKEIDRILGDRLATLEDQKDLPYVDAFVEESQRWRPGLPFGIEHTAHTDDLYKGYFIPKDSVVIGYTWEILREEKRYGSNVEDFLPERFLNPHVKRPTAQWGYGRRMCPGRYFASGSLFLAAATILKLFDVVPAKDDKGKDLPIPGNYIGVGVIAPSPFKCAFKPRSGYAERILSQGIITND